MIKRKKLGQHFLNSRTVAEKIVSAADISPKDIVFELGTGTGILTSILCKHAKKVISIDADKDLYLKAKEQFSDIPNLSIKLGNGLDSKEKFSIFVSNLPYQRIPDNNTMQKLN